MSSSALVSSMCCDPAGLSVRRTAPLSSSVPNSPMTVRGGRYGLDRPEAGAELPLVVASWSSATDLLRDLRSGLAVLPLPLPRGRLLLVSSCKLSPLPDFLSGVEAVAMTGDTEVGKVGDGALSIPDAEVVGIDEGVYVDEEKGLLVDGGIRPSEFLRIRGVDEERGTGSEPDDERAGVCGGCLLAGCSGRGLGECKVRGCAEEELFCSKVASAARKLMGSEPSSVLFAMVVVMPFVLVLRRNEEGQVAGRRLW